MDEAGNIQGVFMLSFFFFSFFFRKRNLGIYLVIEYNRVPQQTDTYSHYLVSCIAVVLSLSVKQNKEKYFQAVFW